MTKNLQDQDMVTLIIIYKSNGYGSDLRKKIVSGSRIQEVKSKINSISNFEYQLSLLLKITWLTFFSRWEWLVFAIQGRCMRYEETRAKTFWWWPYCCCPQHAECLLTYPKRIGPLRRSWKWFFGWKDLLKKWSLRSRNLVSDANMESDEELGAV